MPGKLSADSCAVSMSIQCWESVEFPARHSMAAPVKSVEKYLLTPSRTGRLGDDVSLKNFLSFPPECIWGRLLVFRVLCSGFPTKKRRQKKKKKPELFVQSSASKLGTQREPSKTISLALTFESVFKEFEISRGSEEGLYGKSLEEAVCSGEFWVNCDESGFWKLERRAPRATDRNNRAWGDVVQHFQTSKAQQLLAFLGKAWLHFIPHFCWRDALSVAGVLLVRGSWTGATGPEGPWHILILGRTPEMENNILKALH